MNILISILKTIIAYLILLFVGTNLLGIVFRGLLPTHRKDSDGNLVVLINPANTRSTIITVIFTLISVLYLYALYHFWNVGIMLSGLIIMLTRIPDLLFEMKTGERIKLKNIPKQPIDIFCTILSWFALPLIWCSFYYLK